MMRRLAVPALALCLAAASCEDEPDAAEAPIRGLITTEVRAMENAIIRRYPGVLEPSEITALSFEVAGKLEALDLTVGQRVATGDVLATLDDEQFRTEIANREASVDEAAATLSQAEDDQARQEQLLERGAVTRVSVDQARTAATQARARLTQAEQSLESARENLDETTLRAPFDGIVNSVEADSFQTVQAGATIATIYAATAYEVSFSVSFDVVERLVVGTPAQVRLADDPNTVLSAVVSELGDRADTVSSFPVVIRLTEQTPVIRAGMAVEVSFAFELPAEGGFLIPITAAIKDGRIPDDAGDARTTVALEVYVFDPDSSTVARRGITMAGIRENQLLVIDGLEVGDRVATRGVSFLRDGMDVRLIEDEG